MPKIPDEDLLKLYGLMVKVRMVDARMLNLQRQGRLGFYIGSTGEEATHIGSAYALRPEDWVFPAYREPGPAFWRGTSLETYINTLMGNAEDPNHGRQMPNHLHDRDRYYVSISSPVGTQIPQATGAAMAETIKCGDGVVLTYFGEGTTSQGDFHVGLNFAGVYKAPVIFFCRNNGYAISTPFSKQTASADIASKAAAYGIEGVKVDGNDILAVIHVTREAAERARRGQGATLIEAVTYRAGAHSSSDDPSGYREPAEEEAWKTRDPLVRFKKYLLGKKLWDETKEKALCDEIQQEVTTLIKKCEAVPLPQLETLFDDVYDEMPWHLREQKAELMAYAKEGK